MRTSLKPLALQTSGLDMT